jgi:uncharacterized protein (TIGR00725 family)
MKKLVTVFGPSECKPVDRLYEQSVELGATLAKHNFIVVSGSYEGVMEGVAKGATEASGSAIGVSAEVYHARGRESNKFLSKEVKVKSAVDQLMELLDLGDAYVALGSNPGTLLEVMTAWDFTKKKFLPQKPLILLGEGWRQFDQVFTNSEYFGSYSEIVQHVVDIDAAMSILEAAFGKQLDLPTLNVIQSR